MEKLPIGVLARIEEEDLLEKLRRDLEDALKEYSELDCLVEILQNAIDAVDERRYRLICEAAGRDPKARKTVQDWNDAVNHAVQYDFEEYEKGETPTQLAAYYNHAADGNRRRTEWWKTLAESLGGDPKDLEVAASSFIPEINIIIRLGSEVWIEVEDNGIGIEDILRSFRHQASNKRHSPKRIRRYGVRGSHGWGLTAVLAMSDRIEVVSLVEGSEAQAYAFANYSAFVRGKVDAPEDLRIALEDDDELSTNLKHEHASSGTHIRVQLATVNDNDLLGNTLKNYNSNKFSNLLRLYTPIGQLNDFLMHPAYHTAREDDVVVTLQSIDEEGKEVSSRIKFDMFRLSDTRAVPSHTYDNFVDAGMPSNVSVHTVHRTSRGGDIYLGAAEIQPAIPLVRMLEQRLKNQDALPGYIDENDNLIQSIPRGFHLGLSGGMKAEYIVRQPRSITAAFRGFILSETASPTLGRKHVMDQRQAIAKAAGEYEREYDDVRKKVLPEAIPPIGTPKALKWRRDYFIDVKDTLSGQPVLSNSLRIWAGSESREARTMLLFAELLQRRLFGDLHILRAHLKDRYDFAFLYEGDINAENGPSIPRLNDLDDGGYAHWDRKTDRFYRYGLGEFKALGHEIFNDFDPDNPRKSADAIDLLVCWDFDSEAIADVDWLVDTVSDTSREFEGQTHVWRPGGKTYRRSRPLAVIALISVINQAVENEDLEKPPQNWPDLLPDIYF